MPDRPRLTDVLREWGRIGCLGFGGPPAHIAMLRGLCVERGRWLHADEFEDAVAACGLLPGPASTQLAIFCAWRVRGRAGAVVGGLAFVLPGLLVILALAAGFLAGVPPPWVLAAGAGAGACVPAVALRATLDLLPASWRRAAAAGGSARARWAAYLKLGTVGSATVGPWLVLILLVCGLVELAVRAPGGPTRKPSASLGLLGAGTLPAAGLPALAWTALKVGALSYGGGFVIIPLMQSDAVGRHHWMTDGQFLGAVAMGQITPGPVVHTVAVIGYAAAGPIGGMLAAAVAFTPSFVFVLVGAGRFERLRADPRASAFLDGAGPAAVGAILGSAVALARALTEPWQYALLAVAAVVLVGARRGVVPVLLGGAAVGVAIGAAGFTVAR